MDTDDGYLIKTKVRCPLHPTVSMPRLEHVPGYQTPVPHRGVVIWCKPTRIAPPPRMNYGPRKAKPRWERRA